MRSLLGYLSPYVRSLELKGEELTKERDALLNRLLHAYSGYELKQSVPSYAEAQAAVTKSPSGDEVVGRGTHSTLDLLKELEDVTLQQDMNIADITVEAAREQSKEAFEKEAAEYERRLVKARAEAAAQSGIKDVI